MRKIDYKARVNRIMQVLLVALSAFLLDYLIVQLADDESIWLGVSVEIVGSVLFSPVVGAAATLINCLAVDYLMYGITNYSFINILEMASVALIGIVYRRLCKDDNRFGIREIVIFNYIQILINVCVLFLSTTPLSITFFGFLTNDWARSRLVKEMASLRSYAFSACVSTAMIGTVLIAAGTYFRKKYRELGSVSGHILGLDALAATSVMFPLVSFSSFLSCIINAGCATMCALSKGERKYERTNQLFTLGLMTTLFIGLLQTLLFWLIKDQYFSFFPATQSIISFAEEYYNFFIFVPPFMALTSFLDNTVASEGDEMLCVAGYLGAFVINVAVSILLSGSIGMGGLALGTILGYIFYLLVVSTHFLKKSNTFRIRFWFSLRDIFNFVKFSLINNAAGLCMAVASATFTKAILQFLGSEYLVANTVLCAMMEVYEMINGPSQGAGYLLATYTGEKNKQGIKILFSEAIGVSLLCGLVVALFFVLAPGMLLNIYGVEDSPLEAELIRCIRFSAVGAVAASVGGFLSDYYGNTGKPLWSCLMVVFRTALFPILLCVTFCLDGVTAMGICLMLSQVCAILIFFGFVLVIKGPEAIPYMMDDPDFEKVYMNSFDYTKEEYGRICRWIRDSFSDHGVDPGRIKETERLVMALFKRTEEENGKRAVLGECVLKFIDEPEVIIKDNGVLFVPVMEGEPVRHDVILSCNSNTIHMA